jgi:hypothetical protein
MMPIRPDPDSFESEDPDPGVASFFSASWVSFFLLSWTVYGNFLEKAPVPHSLVLQVVVMDTDPAK